jgi:hypothetical protein
MQQRTPRRVFFIMFLLFILFFIFLLFWHNIIQKNGRKKIGNWLIYEGEYFTFIEDDGVCTIISKEGNIELRFTHENESLISLQVLEKIPDREIIYLWGEQEDDAQRRLWAFSYNDNKYSTIVNVMDSNSPILIERLERYQNFDKIYYLHDDGTIKTDDYKP